PGRGDKARSLTMTIFLLTTGLALVVTGFWVWTAWLAREAQIAETQAKAENLANSVAQHAERSIEAADIVLRNILDRLAGENLASIGHDNMRQLMSRRAEELHQVSAFGVVDATAKAVISSR